MQWSPFPTSGPRHVQPAGQVGCATLQLRAQLPLLRQFFPAGQGQLTDLLQLLTAMPHSPRQTAAGDNG